MLHLFIDGLELNKTEMSYLNRLLKHNWLYPLCDSMVEYRQAKRREQRLEEIANAKQGNYLTLYQRVERVKRQYSKLREVRHTFVQC